jgi:hypothetical protein
MKSQVDRDTEVSGCRVSNGHPGSRAWRTCPHSPPHPEVHSDIGTSPNDTAM